mgnify:CR=1 FL=1
MTRRTILIIALLLTTVSLFGQNEFKRVGKSGFGFLKISPSARAAGMGIKEGSKVEVSLYNPPNGSYVKLQLHQKEFAQLADPKAVLEKMSGIKDKLSQNEKETKEILSVYRQGHCEYHGLENFEVKYELVDMWINYMKPGDFNPSHTHAEDLSFVIFLDVPKELDKDILEFVGTSRAPGSFCFNYVSCPLFVS